MAATAALKGVEDKFFECSFCLDNFKEPKLLPCLHRICRGCLERVIKEHNDGEFRCPLCNELCDIPPEGVDGFRTDFHMKSMLEYIQLQQTAKTEDLNAECGGCSKESRITSYCFKCKGFLCEQCSTDHLTKKMMKEHKGSILSLKEIKEQELTLERLASLTETPRCQSHVDKPAEVCCATCQNLPVCVVCAQFGEHKGHDLHDVRLLARKERLRAEKTLETLEEYEDNIIQLPIRVEKVKKTLSEVIIGAKGKLESQHTILAEMIERRLKDNEQLHKKNKREIDDQEKQEVSELEEQRKSEIEAAVKEINDKFDKLIGELRVKNQDLRNCQKTLHDERDGRMNKGIVLVDRAFQKLDNFVDEQGIHHREELEKISCEAANRKTRYSNFRSTISSILASKDNWTEAQCLPDISKASDFLVQDVKENVPQLESLKQIEASDLDTTMGGLVRIAEEPESVVNIEGVKARGWNVTHMKYTDSGSIVIIGVADNKHTHITVIDREGKIISTNHINQNTRDCDDIRCRTCSPLNLFKLVTTCKDGEISIYNMKNRSHIRKHMSDIVSDWDDKNLVIMVATDQIGQNVYIGNGSRDVFVLDDMLDYRHTLQLPHGIEASTDMIVHDDNLIVCDYASGGAHIVTRKGPGSELVCKLPKPDHKDEDWSPCRVCTDCNGFIYIIWVGNKSGQRRDILTQYSPDGHHLLITKDVKSNVFGIDIVLTDGSEKLILVTYGGRYWGPQKLLQVPVEGKLYTLLLAKPEQLLDHTIINNNNIRVPVLGAIASSACLVFLDTIRKEKAKIRLRISTPQNTTHENSDSGEAR